MKQKSISILLNGISTFFIILTLNIGITSAATGTASLVQDVDSPGRQPFQAPVNWTNDPTQLGGGGSFTVPAGKRLVMEQVSCHLALNQGTASGLSIATWVNGTFAAHRFAAELSPISGGAYTHYWYVDRLVRIYADPGTAVRLDVGNTLGGDGAGWCTVSGYYVDIS